MDNAKKLISLFRSDIRESVEKKGVSRYFRERTSPKYFFTIEEIKDDDIDRVISDAERVIGHDIFGYRFDGDIDYHFNPTTDTSRDNEWSWSLFRTIYWQPLARAYALTGDERYTREFISQMRLFIESWPAESYIEDTSFEVKSPYPGHAWRTIESGIRIYTTWLVCFEVFRNSPLFDDESMALFLLSIRDHARFLMSHYSNHDRSSNWLSMEITALFQIGVMFPEFEESKEWLDMGYRRLTHEIPYCFSNDGVHMERTPIYHLVATISFLQALELGRINGIYMPEYLYRVIVRAAKYVMSLIKPDLSTPMIGDADRDDLTTLRADTSLYEGMNLSFFPDSLNELRAFFSWMHRLTGDESFLFFSSLREEGHEPDSLDYMYRGEGIYLARSSWKGDGDYMMVLSTNLERGERSTHSHEDTGHVELSLYGEDILTDSGRYIYRSSVWRPWRDYFTSSKSHNTLLVDEHIMGSVPSVDRVRGVRGILNSYKETSWAKIIDLSHNGYSFMDDPVFHRRIAILLKSHKAVIADFITGRGESEHDFSLYYNFERGKVELDEDGGVFESGRNTRFRFTLSSDRPFEMSLLEGSEDPKGGWISYGYPVRVKRPQLIYSYRGKVPMVVLFGISKEGEDLCVKWEDGKISILDGSEKHTLEV